MSGGGCEVELGEVVPDDLEVFYRIQNDAQSNELAGVYPRERDDFDEHWVKIHDDPKVIARSIIYDGKTVGNINSFPLDGETYVGYWIERTYWGLGVSTRALTMFLQLDKARPMYASVDIKNIGSCTVLERCGFIKMGQAESAGTDRYAPCVLARYCLNSE